MIRKDSELVRPLMPGPLGIRGQLVADMSTFSPADVSGLKLWFDAASGVYTDDAATTAAVSDGDAVGAWRDRSANAQLFIQATVDSQPALKIGANGINGHPVVRADGAADYLKVASASALNSLSGRVFAVVRPVGALKASNAVIATCDEATATRYFQLFWNITGTIGWTQRNNDTQGVTNGDSTVEDGTAYILEWMSSGTSGAMRVDGVGQAITVTGGTNNGDWTADTSARDNITLFAAFLNGAASAFVKGDIAELLAYEPQLSDVEATNVRRFLANKYNVAL